MSFLVKNEVARQICLERFGTDKFSSKYGLLEGEFPTFVMCDSFAVTNFCRLLSVKRISDSRFEFVPQKFERFTSKFVNGCQRDNFLELKKGVSETTSFVAWGDPSPMTASQFVLLQILEKNPEVLKRNGADYIPHKLEMQGHLRRKLYDSCGRQTFPPPEAVLEAFHFDLAKGEILLWNAELKEYIEADKEKFDQLKIGEQNQGVARWLKLKVYHENKFPCHAAVKWWFANFLDNIPAVDYHMMLDYLENHWSVKLLQCFAKFPESSRAQDRYLGKKVLALLRAEHEYWGVTSIEERPNGQPEKTAAESLVISYSAAVAKNLSEYDLRKCHEERLEELKKEKDLAVEAHNRYTKELEDHKALAEKKEHDLLAEANRTKAKAKRLLENIKPGVRRGIAHAKKELEKVAAEISALPNQDLMEISLRDLTDKLARRAVLVQRTLERALQAMDFDSKKYESS